MADLPFPFFVDRAAAQGLGMAAGDVEQLARTAALFQWLLSGLMLNVSYFKPALKP